MTRSLASKFPFVCIITVTGARVHSAKEVIWIKLRTRMADMHP